MNYPIIICLLLFSFPIFIDVYGQQGSRDLMAEYCQNNWIKDLVRCANYVPPDYEANKAKYQALEAEKEKQAITQSNLAKESQRTCPLGSHLGVDNFGNQVCLDSTTNQVVSPPNTGQSSSGGNGVIIGIIVLILIVIIAGIAKSRGKSSSSQEEKLGRQYFSESDKEETLRHQDFKCNNCQQPIGQVGARLVWFDFDHKDGKNWNNDISNCQALCKNCHADKTERDR